MRTPGVGCKTFSKILSETSPQQLFNEPRRNLVSLGLNDKSIQFIQNPDWEPVDQDISWLQQPDHHILTIIDKKYPPLLKEIPSPPPLLFIKGNPDALLIPQIAIVGSRNPSSLGKQIAEDFARTLAEYGFSITSGLALGIDAASHRGALKADGATIAVAGTGVDRIYPARHKQLASEIIKNGALISEFPLGTPAKASHFPQRNRIISGVSIGLLVVEAAIQSGSLITARMALEQDREVFAIPGSIQNPLAKGCNSLIREGAKLVETTHDILEELGQFNLQMYPTDVLQEKASLDLEHQNLLDLVLYNPTSVDTLVGETGKPVEIISSMLLVLELQGYITSEAGGYYTRLK